jgi:hypothetical protein
MKHPAGFFRPSIILVIASLAALTLFCMPVAASTYRGGQCASRHSPRCLKGRRHSEAGKARRCRRHQGHRCSGGEHHSAGKGWAHSLKHRSYTYQSPLTGGGSITVSLEEIKRRGPYKLPVSPGHRYAETRYRITELTFVEVPLTCEYGAGNSATALLNYTVPLADHDVAFVEWVWPKLRNPTADQGMVNHFSGGVYEPGLFENGYDWQASADIAQLENYPVDVDGIVSAKAVSGRKLRLTIWGVEADVEESFDCYSAGGDSTGVLHLPV